MAERRHQPKQDDIQKIEKLVQKIKQKWESIADTIQVLAEEEGVFLPERNPGESLRLYLTRAKESLEREGRKNAEAFLQELEREARNINGYSETEEESDKQKLVDLVLPKVFTGKDEELKQEARLAILESLELFDVNTGGSFVDYVRERVKGHVSGFWEREQEFALSSEEREILRVLRRVIDEKGIKDLDAVVEETLRRLAGRRRVSEEDIRELLPLALGEVGIVSLEEPRWEDEEEEPLEEYIPSSTETPERAVVGKEIWELLRDFIVHEMDLFIDVLVEEGRLPQREGEKLRRLVDKAGGAAGLWNFIHDVVVEMEPVSQVAQQYKLTASEAEDLRRLFLKVFGEYLKDIEAVPADWEIVVRKAAKEIILRALRKVLGA